MSRATWLLPLLGCAVLARADWEGALKAGRVTAVNDGVGALLEAGDDRGARGVVVFLNANPSFFDRCDRCRELDAYFQVFADGYVKAWGRAKKSERKAMKAAAKKATDEGEEDAPSAATPPEVAALDGVRFASVEASQKTLEMFQQHGYGVPALVYFPPGASTWEEVVGFGPPPASRGHQQAGEAAARGVKKGAEDRRPEEGAAAALHVDPLRSPRTRAERRAWHMKTQAQLDAVLAQGETPMSLQSLSDWVAGYAGARWAFTAAQEAKLEELLAPATAGSSKESGFSPKQLLFLGVGLMGLVAFVYRAFYGPCFDADADLVQSFLRGNGWWYLLLIHSAFMGGLYWCLLNGPRDGPGLFLPGRGGQYVVEGLFVSALIGAGSYGMLALHRLKEFMYSFHEFSSFTDELKAASGRDAIRNIGMVVVAATLLLSMSFLHKSYWYLNGTIFRGHMSSFTGLLVFSSIGGAACTLLTADIPMVKAKAAPGAHAPPQ